MIPLYKKYYDAEGQKQGMLRMIDFINTEQTTASVLWGILVGMEEQKALGADVGDDMIRTVKSSLMGRLPVSATASSRRRCFRCSRPSPSRSREPARIARSA